MLGVIVDQTRLRSLTFDFLDLKREFFPNATLGKGVQPSTELSWVLAEIKGADIRKLVAHDNRDRRRYAHRFLGKFVSLLELHQVRIVGRLFVKGIAAGFDGKAVYASSMQTICGNLHHWLNRVKDEGIVIADSRLKHMNSHVSFSIFTQKFKRAGDDHSRVAEIPAFGHSENHIGLQIADLLCSALIFPMAVHTYCTNYVMSLHVRPRYADLRSRYGSRLSNLQHRYIEPLPRAKWRGGVVVSDGLAQRSGSILFKEILPKLPGPKAKAALPAPESPSPATPKTS